MSSSFPEPAMRRAIRRALSGSALAGSVFLAALPASAAQVYVQPIISVQAQTSSNLRLDPDESSQQTEGYFAEVATVIGVATPRSDTTIKPRVRYRNYPDESELNRFEGFLDLNSYYTGQRSRFQVFGRFEHRDEVHAERTAAEFDELAPDPLTGPETGRVQVGATRDVLLLIPTYKYSLTQRTEVGVTATVQSVDYSPDDAFSHVDFEYYEGKTFVGWALSQRSRFSVGALASTFEAKNIDAQFDSYGATAGFEWDWSAAWQSGLSMVYQSSDIERTEPFVYEDTTEAWGANFETAYEGRVTQMRVNLGRIIMPSGTGGLLESDNVRLQYDHEFTQRWKLTAAGRYLHQRALERNRAGNDRDYIRTELALRWMMTRTWFIEGGYQYTWQEYESDARSVDDNTFSISFGYRGLPRQR